MSLSDLKAKCKYLQPLDKFQAKDLFCDYCEAYQLDEIFSFKWSPVGATVKAGRDWPMARWKSGCDKQRLSDDDLCFVCWNCMNT